MLCRVQAATPEPGRVPATDTGCGPEEKSIPLQVAATYPRPPPVLLSEILRFKDGLVRVRGSSSLVRTLTSGSEHAPAVVADADQLEPMRRRGDARRRAAGARSAARRTAPARRPCPTSSIVPTSTRIMLRMNAVGLDLELEHVGRRDAASRPSTSRLKRTCSVWVGVNAVKSCVPRPAPPRTRAARRDRAGGASAARGGARTGCARAASAVGSGRRGWSRRERALKPGRRPARNRAPRRHRAAAR